MITVPPFILKRLYVKGSLQNNDQSFQFRLKNTLGSGYGTELLPLTLDGRELPLDDSYLVLEGREVPFSAINKDNPFTLPMNRELMVVSRGNILPPGPHKIGFRFVAQGLGKLGFEVTDVVGGDGESPTGAGAR
jgi:hypothetical protein